MSRQKAADGPPGHDATRGGESAGLMRLGGRAPIVAAATEVLTHLQRRCLQDAINDALAATHARRAAAFLAARPDPSRDFMGQVTPEQARAKWHELTAIAEACRARAVVARTHTGVDADVAAALEEAA
jgi:hypothetical protein